MSDKVSEYIFMAIAVLIGLLVAVLTNGGVVVCVICIAIVFGLCIYFRNKSRNDKAEIARHHYTFDKKNNTMTLLQRSDISANILCWRQTYKSELKYNPSKLIYTGASVGGVSMGGFHTTEEHYQERPTKPSGRYLAHIKFYDGDELFIKKIILSGEILEQAKKDKVIKKFLDGNCLLLTNQNPKSDLEGKFTLKEIYSNQVLRYYYEDSIYANSGLTPSQYQKIDRWIRGGNN